MGLDRVALRQVVTVAKNSNRLKKSIKDMENKVIDKGLELIEKAGINPNTLPIDVRSVLRGEAPTVDSSKLLTPAVICSQPLMTVQQKEEVTRLITGAQDQVTSIYDTTNSIKETVLSLQTPVVQLQDKTQPVTNTINTVSDIVQIIKILAIPTSFPPGAGVPLSVPNTFASTLITLGELLDAGVHFGHQASRWNPKMFPYIYAEQNGIHVIDLVQTARLLTHAYEYVRKATNENKTILFVGTKRQAQKIISESAINSGQYYMNHRWLGGTLTNWKTISKSIVRLKSYDEILNKEDSGLTKKELVGIQRQRNKLEASLGGIKDMGGLPDALFVIDTNKEHIAIKEANVLKIPVIAVIDSNSNPDGVDFPIPGNDDSARAIRCILSSCAHAFVSGSLSTVKATRV